jgi:hypothetical protein
VHQALFNHLSVQFSDVDFQEISGKHPENSGNLLSQAGFSPINLLSQTGFFPGNLLSQTGFYFPEISLSDRLWSGERTTGHGNFLRIILLCGTTAVGAAAAKRYPRHGPSPAGDHSKPL